MNLQERTQLLEEAGELISRAIGKIEEAVYGTSQENHANAYIIPHLRTWIGEGNSYDTDVYKYIKYLEREEQGEEYDEYEEE